MKRKYLFRNLFLILILTVGIACNSDSQTTETTISNSLDLIIVDVENGVYGETHSLLVYDEGSLLTERYFEGWSASDVHYQYSVTKSVASTLIGIAVDKGFITSLDTPLLDFFPDYPDIQNDGAWKQSITLEDVLAMRAGFQWDEWTYNYLDERNDANKLIRSDDMIQFMLDLPMASVPGSQFTYNSGCSMLLSGIIERTTGLTTEEFAQEHLFQPLGISQWDWEQGNDDLFNTGWGLHLRPLDMLKIGQLFFNNGVYGGQQVVSQDWVQTATSNQGNNYGFQWWLSASDSSFSARGWGGQFIFIYPNENLILVTTAGNFNGGSGGFQLLERIRNSL